MDTGNVQGSQGPRQNLVGKRKPTPEERMATWTVVVGIFTVFLFGTSAVSNWFTWQEWRSARKTEERNVEQLRAVLRLSNVIVSPGTDILGNKTAAFTTTFQNFGSTRTARVRAWDSVQYFPGEIPNNFDATKPNIKIDLADTIVAANSPISLAAAGIPYTEFEESLSHKGNLLIWGQAIYADIFDPNVDRHVSFCQVLHLEKIPAKAATKTEAAVPEQIVIRNTAYKNECNKSE